MRHDGAIDRSPDVDDPEAALEQLVRLVRVMQFHPPLRRPRRLVDVDPRDGSAGCVRVRPADRVVEDGDLVGAGDIVQQQPLDLGVVYALDVLVVQELGLLRRHALDGLERVLVEMELVLAVADVVHFDLDDRLAEVALRVALGWLLDVVVRGAAVLGLFEEVEFGSDGASGDVFFIDIW